MKWLRLLALLLALASCANSNKSDIKKDTVTSSNRYYSIAILSASDIDNALHATKEQQ